MVQDSGGIGNNPPLFLLEHFEETISLIDDIKVIVSDTNHYTMGFVRREDINQYISPFFESH